MGYETYFQGTLAIDPALNADEVGFLNDFCHTRRMNRTRGPLYVASTENYGQNSEPDILDFNNPHPDQPGLWCSYSFSEDGLHLLVPDESTRFYYSAEWMVYLLTKLLNGKDAQNYIDEHFTEDPRLVSFTCNHLLNGEITADGEDTEDRWKMVITDSKLKLYASVLTYVEATKQLM